MKKIKRLLLLFILFLSISVPITAQTIYLQKPELIAIYTAPAAVWESEALPLGNGYMGAMVFGGVYSDRIQVNEHTLWSGGPGASANYNGGHLRTPEENHRNMQTARELLQKKMNNFTATQAAYIDADGRVVTSNYGAEDDNFKAVVNGITGTKDNFGSYMTLGNILIETNDNLKPDFTDYTRSLNLDNAIHTVSYKENGVAYTREYFMSYPGNIMVIRLKADQAGKISRTFSITSPQPLKTIAAQGNTITMTGRPSGHSATTGLKYAQQLQILNTGGTLTLSGQKIIVKGADEVLALMSASTNYVQSMDDQFNYFSSTDPLTTVQQNIVNASSKSYDALLEAHQQDYHALYDRVGINLGNVSARPSKTTDQLLTGYYKTNTQAENQYVEMLYYQFGRYLLISSSRPNTLPANLQGVWGEGLSNPWNADYHTNINIQMNYWLTQPTNLSECHIPMIDFINSLVPRGTLTAKHYYCRPDGSEVRGWTTHHENNVWGNTAPAGNYPVFYFPAGAGWMCQDIWEYYLFNADKPFLEANYQTVLDAALFWVDNLWRDERDGGLVANPSFSPEHGEFSLGASCDQAIIWQLFDIVINASKILNKESSEVEEIKAAKSKLTGPQIGLGGQFMEWKDEVTRDITGDGKHRHVNHLFWIHPGSQVVAGRSLQDDAYVAAMKNTLNTRGDDGTGWSKAWKINFWARLRDGNHAHTLLKSALSLTYVGNPANIGGVYQNLFDTHPPFQIDGNFGATAGVTEMLLQSQGDCIELLPALPGDWSQGVFKGIKARGNFELAIQWNGGVIDALEIKSNVGNDCAIKYDNIQGFTVKERGGSVITPTVLADNKIVFPTTAGTIYDITND
ncbi:hypothetical protein EZS27_000724 [termite gut metagenome]|uniref:Uncharacterized protein n=1 Tax=termite gut metagenome TaxID=433724 RepID=A0A5J4T0X4_9ZZZZ